MNNKHSAFVVVAIFSVFFLSIVGNAKRYCINGIFGTNLFNVIHSWVHIVGIHIVFQVSSLERSTDIVIAKGCIDFFTTLPIRLQNKAQSTSAIIWSFGIVACLIAWFFCFTFIYIHFTMSSCVSGWTRTIFGFHAFSIIFTWYFANG